MTEKAIVQGSTALECQERVEQIAKGAQWASFTTPIKAADGSYLSIVNYEPKPEASTPTT